MPYTHKKVGDKYVVYKKGKKVGETKGTKVALDKYLAALHIADKPKKESVKEARMPTFDGSKYREQEMGNTLEFWVVEKPMDPEDDPMTLVHQSDPFKFANQVRGGLMPEQVFGFYLDEDEALNAAHDQVHAVFEAAKALEEKKEAVIGKLDKHIKRLQQEINQHMKEAGENPDQADNHHMEAERKMAMIKELRGKHKMVGESRRELVKKEKED